MRRKTQRRLSLTLLLAAVTTASLGLGHYWGSRSAIPHAASSSDAYEFFDTLVDLRSQILRNYVEPVDEQKLQRGAIEGMLKTLDPYSNYFPKEELVQFDKLTHGQFSGIGAEFSQDPDTGDLVIVSPLEDSPALKAGIQAGDRVLKVNGESLKGAVLEDLFNKVGGPPGSEVTLTVLHQGDTTPVQITVKRAVMTVKSVRGVQHNDDGSWDFMLDPEHRIAYVRISSFMENTSDELDKALLPLFNGPQPLRGIILDLRYNPGGLLTQAVAVSDRFLESGVIVSTRGRDGKNQYVAEAKKEGTYPHVPLVILINEHSASAAEIVSGALKDHNRAVLIGTRTFGKGSVQNLITLDGGQSALKLTTAYYYLPSGRNIMRKKGATVWGVDPDPAFNIPLTDDENTAVIEARMKSEIIRPRKIPTSTQPAADTTATTEPVQPADRQLQRALEVLVAFQSFNGQPEVESTSPSVSAGLPTTQPAPHKPAATQPATGPGASVPTKPDESLQMR